MQHQWFYYLMVIFLITGVQTTVIAENNYTDEMNNLSYKQLLLDFYQDTGENGTLPTTWIETFSSFFMGDTSSGFKSLETNGFMSSQDYQYLEEMINESDEGNYSRIISLLGVDESRISRIEMIQEDINNGDSEKAMEALNIDPAELTEIEQMVEEVNQGDYSQVEKIFPKIQGIITALIQPEQEDVISDSEDMDSDFYEEISSAIRAEDLDTIGEDSTELQPSGGEGYTYNNTSSGYDITTSGKYHLGSNITVPDASYAIRISADDVELNGNQFSITGNGNGHGLIIQGNHVDIRNILGISQFSKGITAEGIEQISISNCSFTQNTEAVEIENADSADIHTNLFYNNENSVLSLDKVREVIFKNNLVNKNSGSIRFTGGEHTEMSANLLSYNSGELSISDMSTMNFTTNLLSYNAKGITLSDGTMAVINNNLFSYNTGDDDCISLEDIQRSQVTSNLFSYNKNGGVSITGGDFALIMLNLLSQNGGMGISVDQTSKAGINLNILFNNEKDGITCSDVNDLAIHYNTLAFSRGLGISLASIEKALVVCNVLSYNTGSVKITDSNNVTVGSNTISYNLGDAFDISNVLDAAIVTNTIAYNEKNGFNLSDIGSLLLERNVLSYNGESACTIHDCENAMIIENVLSYCTDSGFEFSECNGITSMDNVFYANGNQFKID